MRVLVFQESYVAGGADVSLMDLIKAWPRTADEFIIAVNREHPRRERFAGARCAVQCYRSWRESRLGLSTQLANIVFVRWCAGGLVLLRLLRLIRRIRPDCVVLNNGGFPGGSSLYLALIAQTVVTRRRAIMVVRNYAGPRASRWKLSLAALLIRAGRVFVVAVSQSLAEHLIRVGGIRRSQVRLIYNGVAEPFETSDGTSGRIHDTVAVVGTVEKRKGHEVLLRALALLPVELANVRAVFIGQCEAPERRRLEDIARACAVDRRVEWRGHIESVDAVFRHVGVLVVPSVYQESFGRVAAEAMARGIPVIASDCGGLPEVVQNGVSGIVVPRADPVALAAAIVRLNRDAEFRQRLKTGGVRRYRERFSAAMMADHFARLVHGKCNASDEPPDAADRYF